MSRLKLLPLLAFAAVFLTGCSLSLPGLGGTSNPAKQRGPFLSSDGGTTFEPRSNIDEKQNLASTDIISLVVDPNDPKKILAGTLASGIFMTENQGESWIQVADFEKVYAIAINPQDSNIIYATGFQGGQGKIFTSKDGGQSWQGIYSEPATGTIVLALALDPFDPNVIYLGNTLGILSKTQDAGKNWSKLAELQSPISDLALDSGDTRNVYLLSFEKGVYKLDYSGALQFEDEKDALRDLENENFIAVAPPLYRLRSRFPRGIRDTDTLVLTADPKLPGVVYAAGSSGVARTRDGGNSWEMVPILNSEETTNEIPIRALAVAGDNSQIIYYGNRGVFYRSFDQGQSWEAMSFRTNYSIEAIQVNPQDPQHIFLGIRKI